MDTLLNPVKKIIPKHLFTFIQPAYHYFITMLSVLVYRFPSRKIKVIAVTGTKGKSTTTEIINSILEEAGKKTALSNTIRFKIGDKSEANMYKMSMPGRFFIQRFIRRAVYAKCDYLIMEMTSQGAQQYRHKFIEIDGFVFTNISPEHIESHGSYENYLDAKLEIARQLSRSTKRPRIMIVNGDDKESQKFLSIAAEIKKTYSLNDQVVATPLPGEFNKYNVLAAITLCRTLGIEENTIRKAVENFKEVKGRVEKIEAGQDFTVIIDYAHTIDSMEKLYKTFPNSRKICVFGATGGGRDKWKRQGMGEVAEKYCDEIILTDDDSYDENPAEIAADVARGIKIKKPKVIVDRRQAIREAIKSARSHDTVLITGKGTDPYLMGPNGTKITWNDAEFAREEIREKINNSK